jgi:hypothetical protein
VAVENTALALTTTISEWIVMATPSYRERMKAARAEARAKREAEKAEWLRWVTLRAECRRMSLEAVKADIRGRVERVTRYTYAQLRAQANEMIGPWLVVKAEARIAERNSKHLSKSPRPADGGLPLNEARAQNGAQ